MFYMEGNSVPGGSSHLEVIRPYLPSQIELIIWLVMPGRELMESTANIFAAFGSLKKTQQNCFTLDSGLHFVQKVEQVDVSL